MGNHRQWCSRVAVLALAGATVTGNAQQSETQSAPAPAAVAPYPETIPVAVDEPAKPPEPAPRRGLAIEEIIVTAQKREESASTVPIAITAYSGDDLATLGVTDTRDLRNLVPGFSAADSGYNTPIYTLRGIGFNDSTYNATSTVGIYVDEVNLPYSIMSKGANLDLQRVEVLKGPQGILYGRNTTGGLINYIAKKPTDMFQTGVTATYSRFETTDVEAYVSGPIVDSIKGRLAVRDIRSQEGWQYSQRRPDDHLGKVDKQSFRGALDWQAADDLSFRLVADGWIDKSESQAPQAVGLKIQQPVVPNTPVALAALGRGLNDAVAAGALDLTQVPVINSIIAGNVTLAPQVANYPIVPLDSHNPRVADWAEGYDWRLNDSFNSVAGRTDWNFAEHYKFTGILSYLQVQSDGSQLLQSGVDSLNSDRILYADIETTAIELRVAREAGADYNWLLGVNASYDDGYEENGLYVQTVSVLFPDPITGHTVGDKVSIFGDQDAVQLAAFANGDVSFAEHFKLSGGARFTRERRDYQGCSFTNTDAQGPFGTPSGIPGLFTALSFAHGGHGIVLPGTGHQQPGELIGDCFSIDEHGNPGLFTGQITDNNLSGRIALDFQPADGFLYYGSVARGFKSGGFPVLNATNVSQFKPTKQEELLAYELGAKVTLLDGKLRVNTAGFYYDYKDKQLLTRFLDPIFGPLPLLRNAPKSRVSGVELDFQSNPFDGLYLAAAGAYIRTKILEFESTDIDGDKADFAGKPFNFTPKLTYTVITDYTPPFSFSDAFEIGIGGDYAYTGKTNSTLEGDPRFRHLASGVYGARIRASATSGVWIATLFARNITNELTTISNFNVGDGIARFVGPPRTYGVTLSVNF